MYVVLYTPTNIDEGVHSNVLRYFSEDLQECIKYVTGCIDGSPTRNMYGKPIKHGYHIKQLRYSGEPENVKDISLEFEAKISWSVTARPSV